MTIVEVIAPAVLGSLSPSRAADFKSCPLVYRLRCIDRLPQQPSRVATRGTLVHAVLESLFDLPSAARTLDAALALLPEQWARLREQAPEVQELFGAADGAEFLDWISSAGELLANYFRLEDPSAFEPSSREQLIEAEVDGVRLRGYVDRLDELGDGAVRIVDYKTGHSPPVEAESRVLFQLKFYALVLWRVTGAVPRQLRLIYLADADTLTYEPDADELARFERTVLAIWAAITLAVRTGDFRPSPGPQCAWCDFHAHCPVFGGEPPPYPEHPVLTDPRDADIVVDPLVSP